MLVNADRVYNSCIINQKTLKENLNYLGRSADVHVHKKNEQQQRKPVIDGIRNKKEKKNKELRINLRRKSQ